MMIFSSMIQLCFFGSFPGPFWLLGRDRQGSKCTAGLSMVNGQVHFIIYPADKNSRRLDFIGKFPVGIDAIVRERKKRLG